MKRQYSLQLDEQLYYDFKAIANRNNRSVAMLIRDFMMNYVNQHHETKPTTNPKEVKKDD